MMSKKEARADIRAHRRFREVACRDGLREIYEYLDSVSSGRGHNRDWIKAIYAFTREGPDGPFHGVAFTYAIPGDADVPSLGGNADIMVLRTRGVAEYVASFLHEALDWDCQLHPARAAD